MVIAQITGMSSSKYGGVEKFFVASAQRAYQEGHKYILIYESLPSSVEFIRDLSLCDAEILVIPSRNGKSLSFFLKLLWLIHRRHIEVIHGHFNPAGDIAVLAGFLMMIKKRFKTVHSMLQNKSDGVPITARSEVSLKTRFLISSITALSSKVFFVSNAVKNQYNNLMGLCNKRMTLYLGTNIKTADINKAKIRKELGLDLDKIYLINIAMHVSGKRIEDCLKVLSNLAPNNRNIVFLQIGGEFISEDYEKSLLRFVENNNLHDNVKWLGLKDNVSDFIAAADVMVHFPVSEGLGLVVAEALVQGVPVIATNVGGLSELIINGLSGYLIDVGDIKGATNYVSKLIESNSLRNEFGENGRKHMERIFDIKKQSKQYISQYRQFSSI